MTTGIFLFRLRIWNIRWPTLSNCLRTERAADIVHRRPFAHQSAKLRQIACHAQVHPATAVAFDRDALSPRNQRPPARTSWLMPAGPFQNYGDRPDRVVEACLKLGIIFTLHLTDRISSPATSAFDSASAETQESRSLRCIELSLSSLRPVRRLTARGNPAVTATGAVTSRFSNLTPELAKTLFAPLWVMLATVDLQHVRLYLLL